MLSSVAHTSSNPSLDHRNHLTKSKDADFKIIEGCSDRITGKLKADESFPDLFDQFSPREQGSHKYFIDHVKRSGTDFGFFDTPVIDYETFVPLPADFIRRNNFQVANFMGLLPEIERVWISVDNVLHLWDYNDGTSETYDGLSEVIVSVALSTPKPGVFLDSIKYVLVVATPVEVVLLAMAFDGDMKDLRLIPTSYVVPSDDVIMTKIVGSQVGRIFMGGDNGNIFEFDYDNEIDMWSSLFGTGNNFKVRKIDHTSWKYRLTHLLPPLIRDIAGGNDRIVDMVVDNCRNVLYGLSKNGYLSVFYLGSREHPKTKVVENRLHIRSKAKTFLETNHNLPYPPKVEIFSDKEDGLLMTAVGMFVVPTYESKKVHLVVVLNSGIRIYLRVGCGETGTAPWVDHNEVPSAISIAHIRSPPSPYAVNCSNPDQPLDNAMEGGCVPELYQGNVLQVEKAFYSRGVFLTSQGDAGNNKPSTLVAIYEDLLNRNQTNVTGSTGLVPNLREAISVISSKESVDSNPIGGKVIDIQEDCALLHCHPAATLETLNTVSGTPIQLLSGDSDINSSLRSIVPSVISSNSMEAALTSVITAASLNCQGNGVSWGLNPPEPNSNVPVTDGSTKALYNRGSHERTILKQELFTQHIPHQPFHESSRIDIQHRRRFICLTSLGVHFIKKRYPADLLLDLMQKYGIDQQFPLKAQQFFRHFGDLQSSAMCIGFSCGLPCSSEIVSNETKQAAIMVMRQLTPGASCRLVTAATPTIGAPGAVITTDTRFTMGAGGSASPDVTYSVSHDALYTICGRILRPIWLRLIVPSPETPNEPHWLDVITIDSIRDPLADVRKLIQNYFPEVVRDDFEVTSVSLTPIVNPTTTTGMMSLRTGRDFDKVLKEYAKKTEDLSLHALYRFVSRCIQSLDLLRILLDVEEVHNFPVNWTSLNKVTFRGLIISPLIHGKIHILLDETLQSISNATTSSFKTADDLAHQLFDNCYHYFSTGDLCTYLANKEMKTIIAILQDRNAKAALSDSALQTSIRHCVQRWVEAAEYWRTIDYVDSSTRKGSIVSIDHVCSFLLGLGPLGRLGVVEVCFAAAKNFLPLEQAAILGVPANTAMQNSFRRTRKQQAGLAAGGIDRDWYHGGEMMSPGASNDARRHCYQCLVKYILSIGTSPAHGQISDIQSIADVENAIKEMIQAALQHDKLLSPASVDGDPVFREFLCVQLFAKALPQLLHIPPSFGFVETFLRDKDPLLLWEYYRLHREYTNAAQQIGAIAMAPLPPTPIEKRIEHLKSAIEDQRQAALQLGSASLQSIFDGIDFQELLDVAEIQLQADRYFAKMSSPEIASLRGQLIKFSILYEVCERFRLWDICLLILQASEIEDDEGLVVRVARLWRSIFFRIIPSTADSEEGKAYLRNKRRGDLIDIDTSLPPKDTRIETIGTGNDWPSQLLATVTDLGRKLDAAHSHRSFPVAIIIEELEEVASLLSTIQTQFTSVSHAGWSVKALLAIPITFGQLMEVYVDIFDRWTGKRAEQLLQLLASTTYLLSEWTNTAVNLRPTHVNDYRQLMHAIHSGRINVWQEKLRRHVNTMTSHPSLPQRSRDLLDKILQDNIVINQKLSQLSLM